MKSNTTRTIIIVVAVAMLLGVLLFYFATLNNVNWYTNYRESDKQPYGLNVMSHLLDDLFPSKKYSVLSSPLDKSLPEDSAGNKNYVFIGGSLYLNDDELNRLENFVEAGNDAFISAVEIPDDLFDDLFPRTGYNDNELYDDEPHINANLFHQQLNKHGGYTFSYVFDWKEDTMGWYYFNNALLNQLPYDLNNYYDEENFDSAADTTIVNIDSILPGEPVMADTGHYETDSIETESSDEILSDDSSAFVAGAINQMTDSSSIGYDTIWNVQLARLGYFNDSLVNFIRITYGKGHFYLHTTPMAFTNYQLKNEQLLEYADKVFSHLNEGDIYWDEFNKVPHLSHNSQNEGGDIGSNETFLRYILSQAGLRWAWYTLLVMLLIFLLFFLKRSQRIIPILDPNTNTSLEFVHTVGRLYYLQNDHRKLALQQIRLFLGFIRNRYSLATKELDKEFISKLALKSQVPVGTIQNILIQYTTITNMEAITADQLLHLHSDLEYFYAKCK